MRTDLSGNPQFHDLLDQTKAMCLDAFAHQDVPFEQLVEVLKPNRELSYTPLFQVMFAFQNVPPANLHLPNLKWTPLDIATNTAKFDLTLDIRIESGQWFILYEYNRDLFAAPTIARLGNHFQHLLMTIGEHPEQRISRLAYLPTPEKQQLLRGARRTGDYRDDITLSAYFAEWVGQYPNVIRCFS